MTRFNRVRVGRFRAKRQDSRNCQKAADGRESSAKAADRSVRRAYRSPVAKKNAPSSQSNSRRIAGHIEQSVRISVRGRDTLSFAELDTLCSWFRRSGRGDGGRGRRLFRRILFTVTNDQRLPLSPAKEFQVTFGTNRIDRTLWPLMVAVPHSVSTVTILTSVAPVIESPLCMATVVVGSSAVAKRMPETSDSGMFAAPNEVRISRLLVSVSVPEIFVPLSRSTVTTRGSRLRDRSHGL